MPRTTAVRESDLGAVRDDLRGDPVTVAGAREAVALLTRALDRGPDSGPSARSAAVTVVLRLVFLALGEPLGLPSVRPLRDDLERSLSGGGPARGVSAWPRVLQTFREVFARFGGTLFAPDGCPLLDTAPVVDDPQTLAVLRAVKLDSADPAVLGRVYEALLDRGHRRSTGVYYTPPELTRRLVRAALEPVTPAGRPDDILGLAVRDVACGTGAFVTEACRYLGDRLAEAWDRTAPGGPAGHRVSLARQLVARHCLQAVDIDPLAVELTKLSLWLVCGVTDRPFSFLDHAVRVADALDLPNQVPEWGPVDACLSNPPFATPITAAGPGADLPRWPRVRPGDLGGTADLSYYFLATMHDSVRPGGTCGVVLPRAFLTAPSAAAFRRRLLAERPPSLVWCPDGKPTFDSANVRVAALVLGGRPLGLSADNWWELPGSHSPPGTPGATVGTRFEVIGSMTAGLAYELVGFLGDRPDPAAEDVRFVTTGLIDPHRCLWGDVVCTYLKRRYGHPCVRPGPGMSAALARRLALVRRPKVLVAGVAGPGHRVEAFLDPHGGYCGAVSTFTVFDREDDVARLARLCERLNDPEVAVLVKGRLGATAMGSGLVTITKAFLRGLGV